MRWRGNAGHQPTQRQSWRLLVFHSDNQILFSLSDFVVVEWPTLTVNSLNWIPSHKLSWLPLVRVNQHPKFSLFVFSDSQIIFHPMASWFFFRGRDLIGSFLLGSILRLFPLFLIRFHLPAIITSYAFYFCVSKMNWVRLTMFLPNLLSPSKSLSRNFSFIPFSLKIAHALKELSP